MAYIDVSYRIMWHKVDYMNTLQISKSQIMKDIIITKNITNNKLSLKKSPAILINEK